jgi:hypothetical protein
MQAFLYFNLTSAITYRQPLLEQVKVALPHLDVLDLDAKSGEMLQQYALKVLHDAEQAVVCIKAEENVQDLGALMPLLEELFIEHPNRLVLLSGHHTRLQRMFEARERVKFKVVSEEDVVQKAQEFLQK